MTRIYFNDKPVDAPAGATLKALLQLQACDPALVVVTVDEKFVPGAEYSMMALPDGARVKTRELLGGG
ncbi:MAG: sulfur carrier protein ThiS [Elusimicrobiota bacterium]|nr:sulfur carrier protein ThiS [Elusimicrobiota bacterium]